MGIKEDTKDIIHEKFGPSTGSKIDAIKESDPKAFLEEAKNIIAGIVGGPIAVHILEPVYKKYT